MIVSYILIPKIKWFYMWLGHALLRLLKLDGKLHLTISYFMFPGGFVMKILLASKKPKPKTSWTWWNKLFIFYVHCKNAALVTGVLNTVYIIYFCIIFRKYAIIKVTQELSVQYSYIVYTYVFIATLNLSCNKEQFRMHKFMLEFCPRTHGLTCMVT